MNLPRFSLTHRSIILAFIVVFLVVGTFNFATMPRREDPEITVRDLLANAPLDHSRVYRGVSRRRHVQLRNDAAPRRSRNHGSRCLNHHVLARRPGHSC